MQILQPPTWARPKGYSNGIVATGKLIFVAGQVGWDENQKFQSDHFIDQAKQALLNTVAVLKEAGAGPEHIVRMTWFITDKPTYVRTQKQLGEIYRTIMGEHYPAMSMVVVAALIEDRAKVEIEATAVVP